MKFEKSLCNSYLVFGLIFISLCLHKECYGYKIEEQQHNLDKINTYTQIHSHQVDNAQLNENEMFRMKREVELMDNMMDAPTGDMQEEEDGFWSKVLTAALKVLKSVIAWLNN